MNVEAIQTAAAEAATNKEAGQGSILAADLRRKKYAQGYYLKNQELLKEKSKQYRKNNPEKSKATRRAYAEKNRESLRQKSREWYWNLKKNNPEAAEQLLKKQSQSNKEYRRKNPEKVWKSSVLSNARSRALAKGIPFNLSNQDIIIPEFCPILKIRLCFQSKNGRPHDSTPSIDRIVPELGYVPGNVEVISHRANMIKNCGSLEEHKRIVEWLESKLST